MKGAFFAALLMSMQALAFIIGGEETSEFPEVVRISVGSQYTHFQAQGYESRQSCTATWIGKGILLTAAHCVMHLQLEDLRRDAGLDPEESFLPIPFFVGNKKLHIESYLINKVVKKGLRDSFDRSDALNTLEYAPRDFSDHLELSQASIKTLRNYKNDLALIKTVEKSNTSFLPVSFEELKRNEIVTYVGFGFSVHFTRRDKIEERLEQIKREYETLMEAELSAGMTELEKRKAVSELRKEHESLLEEMNYDQRKHKGQNSVSKKNDLYVSVRKSKSLKEDQGRAAVSSGDSGGPVLVKKGARFYVTGVVSAGYARKKGKKIFSHSLKMSFHENKKFLKTIESEP